MAGEPGGDRLIAHDLGVLVPAPRQRHDKEPGLEDFGGLAVGDQRTRAEIDLGLFADGEIKHHGRRRRCGGGTMEKAMHGMHAAGEAMPADQGLAHGGDRDPLLVPGEDFFAVRFDRGGGLRGPRRAGARCLGRRLVVRGDQGVVGDRAADVQPVLSAGDSPYPGHRASPDPLRSGNSAIGLARSQALDDLPYFVHFEPPVSHCACPQQNRRRVRNRKSESRFYCRLLAPLARDFSGLIRPRFQWLH